jgi:hypothetical protein
MALPIPWAAPVTNALRRCSTRSYLNLVIYSFERITLDRANVCPSCPIPEIARLGRTLRAWKHQFLAYFTTSRANNGGTEAVNGIIELHRRIAGGFRNPDNYRLRMILAAGKLTHPKIR